MQPVCWLIYATACYPLWCAWRANRGSSLAHAVIWAALAWLGRGAVLAATDLGPAWAE